MKFYVCEHCGNIIQFVKASGVPVMCCGQKMKEIIPGVSDGAAEKHVPAVKINDTLKYSIEVEPLPRNENDITSPWKKASTIPKYLFILFNLNYQELL